MGRGGSIRLRCLCSIALKPTEKVGAGSPPLIRSRLKAMSQNLLLILVLTPNPEYP